MAHLNLGQRVVLVLYLLALTYSCAWIPWQLEGTRIGYGWLWSPPDPSRIFPEYHWSALEIAQTTPDFHLLFLRISLATTIGIAAMVLAGIICKTSMR